MLIYLYGADTFRSRQYLREQVVKFKRLRDPGGYNVGYFDAKKEASGKLWSEISAAPFLAERRLVVIENLLNASDKGLLQEFAERAEQHKLPEYNVIIVWQGETPGKAKDVGRLEKALRLADYVQEFPLEKGAALGKWIKSEVTSRGGKIEPSAVEYLVQQAGEDRWQLHHLLNQSLAFCRGETVTLSAVQLFTEEKIEESIFKLIDAIVAGQVKAAFQLLAEERRAGVEDGYIFAMLLRQYRILLAISDLLAREDNLTSDAIAGRIGAHPFVVKKSLSIAKRVSYSELRARYEELLSNDLKTKTGWAGQAVLIDRFVAAH